LIGETISLLKEKKEKDAEASLRKIFVQIAKDLAKEF